MTVAVVAKQATSVIPIVFAAAGDPVGTGLVASLARPGGNVTGLSNQTSDIAAKRLGLLHEVLPGLRRLTIIANINNPLAVQSTLPMLAATAPILNGTRIAWHPLMI
jgi:putative tryptophan/tyrosine transport system substrate-binding protein